MKKIIAQYIYQEDGATAIEYGLIVASIGVAVGALAFLIGGEINLSFTTIVTSLQS